MKVALKEEDYQALISLQQEEEELSKNLGLLEIQYQTEKKIFLEKLYELNNKKEKLGQELFQTYGNGRIDLIEKVFIDS